MTSIFQVIRVAMALLVIGCVDNEHRSGTSSTQATAPSTSTTSAPMSTPARTPGKSDGPLTLVTDRSLVCMVNNQFMGRPQIPVEVDGRTYFGCCEMCKGRLARDPGSRVATDPVSRRSVDKATAVIGRTSDGKALYFESDQTYAVYARGDAP